MTDHGANPHHPEPGERTLHWHVLMYDDPEVKDLAERARDQLASLNGLHMTPPQYLHAAILQAGRADWFSGGQVQQMIQTASSQLADVQPVKVKLSKIAYYPETIVAPLTPAKELAPVRQAALAATRTAGQIPAEDEHGWQPHVTLCANAGSLQSRPLVQALGRRLPEQTVTLRRLSLVVQEGPLLDWNWTTIGSAPLGGQPDPG